MRTEKQVVAKEYIALAVLKVLEMRIHPFIKYALLFQHPSNRTIDYKLEEGDLWPPV